MVATITHHEPHRSQALQDALFWLQLPLLVGIGLEAIPVEPFVIRAVEDWEEAVSPLAVRRCWSGTMAGNEIDWTSDLSAWHEKQGNGEWLACFLMHGEIECDG